MKRRKNTIRYPNLFRKHNNALKRYLNNNIDPDIGIEDMDKLLLEYPYYVDALLTKVQLLIAKGRNREALRYIKIIRKIDPNNHIVPFEEAEALYDLGKKEESLKVFQTALEKNLDDFQFGVSNVIDGIIAYEVFEEDVDYINDMSVYAEEASKILQNEIMDFLLNKSEHIDMTKFRAKFRKKNI